MLGEDNVAEDWMYVLLHKHMMFKGKTQKFKCKLQQVRDQKNVNYTD